VTEPASTARTGNATPPGASAGAQLGAAREASGLSIDAVAQQLKLAPRQVRAIEEGDFSHLPGRTFVRGFIRNYSRLVRLDPDQVLKALPAGTAAPALEAPTLQPTAPTMGELPMPEHSKAGWMRWAIPLALAAVVVAAALYEWARPGGAGTLATPSANPPDQPAATTTSPDSSATLLVNPLAASAPVAESSPPPDPAQPATRDSTDLAQGTPAGGTETAAAPASATVPAAVGGVAIMLTFRDYSWTEIRDRDGRVVLSGMNRGGTTQSVSGAPPLDFVIGNASDVRVTVRGSPVDLAPHTKKNVARFRLP
jgi:cytoskeleton protein RodZ